MDPSTPTPPTDLDPAALDPAILDTLSASRLVDALRGPWGAAGRVFAGFRPVAASLKQPAVRRRLLHELETDADLRVKLWALWLEVHEELFRAVSALTEEDAAASVPELVGRWGSERVRIALRMDQREAIQALAQGDLAAPAPHVEAPPATPQPAPAAPKPPAEERQAAKLRAQVQELRTEVARQRGEQAQIEKRLAEALREAEQWRADASEGQHGAAEARRSAERQTRQLERQQKANAELQAELKETRREQRRLADDLAAAQLEAEEGERVRAEREASLPPGEAWLAVARDLVRQEQAQAAVSVLAPIATRYPQAIAVREALAEAYQAVGATPAAITELCRVARAHLGAGRPLEALQPAGRAVGLAPADLEALRCLREVAGALFRQGETLWLQARGELAGMGLSAAAYRVASEVLLAAGKPGGAGAGKHARLELDTPVEWPAEGGAFRAPIRRILRAIDRNEESFVRRVRGALAVLEKRAPDERTAILAAIARHDDSYRSVLLRRTQPAVVDGSNVAWYGQTRPRLRQLEQMRRELRSQGYFPILVYVDAALVHQIDRRADLQQLIEDGEILSADPGTDADDQILREARETGCPVVTNDRMLEYDPQERIPKLRFAIGPDGPALRR